MFREIRWFAGNRTNPGNSCPDSISAMAFLFNEHRTICSSNLELRAFIVPMVASNCDQQFWLWRYITLKIKQNISILVYKKVAPKINSLPSNFLYPFWGNRIAEVHPCYCWDRSPVCRRTIIVFVSWITVVYTWTGCFDCIDFLASSLHIYSHITSRPRDEVPAG